MVTLQQVEDEAFCRKVEQDMGKRISAIGCAAGDTTKRAHYPRDIQDLVIYCPVYYGSRVVEGPRKKGLQAFQTACSQAVDDGTAVLIHCNRSFHRGPILAAACMISGGHYTKNEAFALISEKRKIYPGHMVEHRRWPDLERKNHFAWKLQNAHVWLQTLWKSVHGVLREGDEIDEEDAEGQPRPPPMIKLRGDDWKLQTASPKSRPTPDRSRGQAASSSGLQPVTRLAARSSREEATRTPRTSGTYIAGSSRGSKNERRALVRRCAAA